MLCYNHQTCRETGSSLFQPQREIVITWRDRNANYCCTNTQIMIYKCIKPKHQRYTSFDKQAHHNCAYSCIATTRCKINQIISTENTMTPSSHHHTIWLVCKFLKFHCNVCKYTFSFEIINFLVEHNKLFFISELLTHP